MSRSLHLHPERYFPAGPNVRAIAGRIFSAIEHLPIVSPHGHTDPFWFASNAPFEDAVSLLVWPDHYLLRMLMSVGISFESLGVHRRHDGMGGSVAIEGEVLETDRRAIWRRFAQNYRLFRGTPSRFWLDHIFASVFNLGERLDRDSADRYFDAINAALRTAEFRPRALFERFGIEVLATTEGALNPLRHHLAIAASGWHGRVITTFRPDDVIDPDCPEFGANLKLLGEMTDEDTVHWDGYLAALRKRRVFFGAHGATATDHGHPTALTADLSLPAARELYLRVRNGLFKPADAELFRAQMLTEMAGMACEDGMIMQLHAGAWRNHNPTLFAHFGRDKGGDVPTQTNFTAALKPLLDRFGMRRDFTLILFTLDESTYSRELAPLAGHYPCLRIGPAWWFHDAPEAMLRYRRATTETAGFYNTVGFNDDTRAFFSIPARHDLARRIDCSYLAELVASHRMQEDEAAEVAADLAYHLPKSVYRL